MKLHANAALGPKGRLTMVRRVVDQEWSLSAAAEAAGVSERTCWKWVGRYRADGEAGLLDRCSAPHTVPGRTTDARGAFRLGPSVSAQDSRAALADPDQANLDAITEALSGVREHVRPLRPGRVSR
jgi:hypothetical protein